VHLPVPVQLEGNMVHGASNASSNGSRHHDMVQARDGAQSVGGGALPMLGCLQSALVSCCPVLQALQLEGASAQLAADRARSLSSMQDVRARPIACVAAHSTAHTAAQHA
jgi:hypothetical protein